MTCGTLAGYSKHRRNGEPPCQACKDAKAEYQRIQRGAMPACDVKDCSNTASARGLCSKHLTRVYRHSDINHRRPAQIDDFWSNAKTGPAPMHAPNLGPCWLWTGKTTTKGYGRSTERGRRMILAHRWAYQQLCADIPAGLELDHLCLVKHCINPWHLDPVTQAENLRREHEVRRAK